MERAGEEALAEQRHVSLVDVLLRLGWLAPSHVDLWRQGRLDSLEHMSQVNPHKLVTALTAFVRWAERRGLVASEIDHVARTPDRRPLRFSLLACRRSSASTGPRGWRPTCPTPGVIGFSIGAERRRTSSSSCR